MSNEEERLKQRLSQALEENELLKALSNSRNEEEITVFHSGNGPEIVIDLGDDSSVSLSSSVGRRGANIPVKEYMNLKETSPYFELGYLYCDESDMDNPNLVLDLDEWIESRDEDEIKRDIQRISSIALLNKLYDKADLAEDGKLLVLRKSAGERLSQLMDAQFVEDR